MKKTLICMDCLIKIIIFILFLTLILTVGLQIVSRFNPIGSYIWTEELSRFLFIYIVCFSCGLAIKSKELINVDLIFFLMNEKTRKIFKIFINIVSITFTLIMSFYAIDFLEVGLFQTSSALGLKMSYVYFSVFLMPSLLSIYLIIDTFNLVNNNKDIK